jgi:hypothetical protein
VNPHAFPAWLMVVLTILAVFRVTRLVNEDTITAPLRRWVVGRDGELEPDEVGRWGYFITCPWCVSIWVGTVVSVVAVLWGDNRVVLIGLLALAASASTGLIASMVDR